MNPPSSALFTFVGLAPYVDLRAAYAPGGLPVVPPTLRAPRDLGLPNPAFRAPEGRTFNKMPPQAALTGTIEITPLERLEGFIRQTGSFAPWKLEFNELAVMKLRPLIGQSQVPENYFVYRRLLEAVVECSYVTHKALAAIQDELAAVKEGKKQAGCMSDDYHELTQAEIALVDLEDSAEALAAALPPDLHRTVEDHGLSTDCIGIPFSDLFYSLAEWYRIHRCYIKEVDGINRHFKLEYFDFFGEYDEYRLKTMFPKPVDLTA